MSEPSNEIVHGGRPKPAAANYPLDTLYVFDYFRTRKAFEDATGELCPPHDPEKPPKFWRDAAAASKPQRMQTYNVLAVNQFGKPLLDGAAPFTEPLPLLKSEAASVNIPPKVAANEPGAGLPEVPPPLRPLEADEELVIGWGGLAIVRNKKWAPALEGAGFTSADRDLLQAIARKVGL